MNGTCAGGTGAFIDQMASLLKTDAAALTNWQRTTRLFILLRQDVEFCKTDIQPLINEGASREDIAASIFQSVVNQTISGLACGKPIRGNVAFLGGPLQFLSELRTRFVETLKLEKHQVISPSNAQLYVALGAALSSKKSKVIPFKSLEERLSVLDSVTVHEVERLQPLFRDDKELEDFRARHRKSAIPRRDIKSFEGKCFLGIDAGSTTTKAVLIDENGAILYSYYGSNNGSPLKSAVKILKDIYSQLPGTAVIANSAVTGYGEGLIKTALDIDIGEIETIATIKLLMLFYRGLNLYWTSVGKT